VTVTATEAEKMEAASRPPRHTWFHERIPTFGVSLKMHKKNALRFMAKSHDTSLTQMSQWMSRCFKMMMPVSEEIWRNLFLTVGIVTPGSWVINNSKQVRDRMTRMQRGRHKPSNDGQQTYDFSTMYTSLKLDVIQQKMEEYIDLVFEYQRQSTGSKSDKGKEKIMMLKYKGRSTWVTKSNQTDTTCSKAVTAERIKEWVRYLLKRLFVKVGNKIQLQEIGLPMGTSCSPFLANLVLFMFEFEFFTNQIAKVRPWHGQLSMDSAEDSANQLSPVGCRLSDLKKLALCTRYIDDLWNPLMRKAKFQAIVKQIYPEWLQLGLEDEGTHVNYLDMTIWWATTADKVEWHSKLYDKKVKMIEKGLKLNKFPHPQSKLSARCKYGVITSQLHRFSVACTQTHEFLKPAVAMYADYVKKGYDIKQIDKYFEKFLRSNMQNITKKAVKQRYFHPLTRRNIRQ
jgi:disulfide oxidoreductase YuzD